uniref:MORN repeat containing protein n=1 Tax=Marseillevirus sp. TaxID=2809551 RepID=A0AA96ELM5_9VIRU|nr:MORN repeat containing protein [Marseillevirus sp.]
MSATTLVEKNGQRTFELPKVIRSGPAKGTQFHEKVTKTLKKTFSVLEGTEIRHGPFSSCEETEVITMDWSFFHKSLVEVKTIHRWEVEKNYVNGKLDGKFIRKNWLYSKRNKEMRLSSTVTSFYKDGLEEGTRTMVDASGKPINSWIFEQGKLVE